MSSKHEDQAQWSAKILTRREQTSFPIPTKETANHMICVQPTRLRAQKAVFGSGLGESQVRRRRRQKNDSQTYAKTIHKVFEFAEQCQLRLPQQKNRKFRVGARKQAFPRPWSPCQLANLFVAHLESYLQWLRGAGGETGGVPA